jgi:dTDP-4-dehydrorhamnose reductase
MGSTTMRAVIIGKSGQLARCLVETAPAGGEPICFGRDSFDLAASSADISVLADARPDVLINAAAYTAVDKAETDREAAFALNAAGPARLADFAAVHGVPLIHVSTDYVFDGAGAQPYREDDPPAPINVYGHSKLEGERAIAERLPQRIILRTSWVFSAFGGNFVKTMLRLAGDRQELRIVGDQIGRPTSAHELARVIWRIARRIDEAEMRPAPWGVYHYADAGQASWADFAEAIFASPEAGLAAPPRIQRIGTEEYPTPSRRPLYSALDTTKIEAAFGVRPRPWREGLREVLARLTEEAAA